MLRHALLAANDSDAPITRLGGSGRKGQVTIGLYVMAIGIAFWWPLVAVAIYFAVAAVWLVPDKRFEQIVE